MVLVVAPPKQREFKQTYALKCLQDGNPLKFRHLHQVL